jgi:WS/DGAT/MGAT family acyltransferase
VVDDGFDIDFHIRHARVDEPGDLGAVLALAAPAAAEAFDPARPPWQLLVLGGLVGDQAAFILRFHHALTDGVGGVGLAAELFDRAAEPPDAAPVPSGEHDAASSSYALETGAQLMRAVRGTVRDPLRAARDGIAMAQSIARFLAPAHDQCAPLLTGRSLNRRLDVFDLSLHDLREAGRAAGGTLNDALLGAVSGAIAHYHASKGNVASRVRVTMPINLRGEGDEVGGNRFTPARFVIPASCDDVAGRVAGAGAVARAWRAEPAIALTEVIAGALDALPAALVTRLFGEMLRHVDADVSNIPGLARDAYLGGAHLDRLWAVAPPAGAALSVTLLSHLDRCCIAVACDTAAISDLDLMARCVHAGFEEVLALAPAESETVKAS